MASRFPQTLTIHVTKEDIEEGKCLDPNKCMLKLAIKREIGGHGYVHVEGGVAAITRRPDYREKGFLPRSARVNMVKFDKNKDEVKPFTFKMTFHKTTKIYKLSAEQRKEINKKVANRKANGWKMNRHTMRERITGMANTV